MKILLLVILSAVITFAQFNENEVPQDISIRYNSSVYGSFTDLSRYNTWDHAHIPLGILETANSIISMNLGLNRLKWTNENNNDLIQAATNFQVPFIRVGQPDKFYMDCFYSITPISVTDDSMTLAMPFNQFGLSVVGQLMEGVFKLGLSGRGYHGKEKWDVNGNRRIIMGAEDVGVCIGFEPHESVILNVYATASGYVDSLYIDENIVPLPEERFAWLQLPRINVAIDFGMDDFPYKSNFSYCYGRNNFVYTVKPYDIDPGWSIHNPGDDVDPIVSDSIAWHWQNIYKAKIKKIAHIDPAFHVGFMHLESKHMKPNEDNHPRKYAAENKGWEWETRSFQFGFGTAFWLKEMLNLWFEYSRSTFELNLTGENLAGIPAPGSNGYDRIGFGLTHNFHEIPKISFPEGYGLYFRFGFLHMKENGLISGYKNRQFTHMYPIYNANNVGDISDLNVQLDRYHPWDVAQNEFKTTNVSFSLGGSIMDKMLETNLHFGILRREYTNGFDYKYKGFEFGLDIIYNKF